MDKNPNIDEPEDHLEGLDEQFLSGIQCMQQGDVDSAAEHFRRILKVEPRLAEPRMELARILMETSQLQEAEDEIREAIRILESGGQWIEDLEPNQVLSVGYGLLAEILRTRSQSDDAVFGDPEVWKRLVEEAHAVFRKARELDPKNAHADYWAGGFDVDAGEEAEPESDPA